MTQVYLFYMFKFRVVSMERSLKIDLHLAHAFQWILYIVHAKVVESLVYLVSVVRKIGDEKWNFE